ncbi:MAG: hypothetical protein CL476_13765 [Acidobacteria bacterium]|jgi:hypothetical protein|nr:hypothetical protein [Acidobacteriota bacterium]|tara:strand:+ start:254 stop:469 length:216 start_codon:yes stop_codon:yes gene_type:complete
MSPDLPTLKQFVSSIPRLSLGSFPTLLVRLGRLSDHLGIDLWSRASAVGASTSTASSWRSAPDRRQRAGCR